MIKRILAILTGLFLMLGVALAETHAGGPSSGVSTWTGGGSGGSTAYTYSDQLQCGNFSLVVPGLGTVPIRVCNTVVTPCQCLSAFGVVIKKKPTPHPVAAWYFCFSC